VHRAGREVLDQHVGAREQAFHRREPAWVLHVDDDALLVAVEVRVVAHPEAEQVARRIALRRGLDADDLGPEVRQHHAGGGPEHRLGELEHHGAGKGAAHGRTVWSPPAFRYATSPPAFRISVITGGMRVARYARPVDSSRTSPFTR